MNPNQKHRQSNTHLRRDLVTGEYPDVATIPDGGRSLQNLPALAQHLPVETGALEEVGACKVQFPEVAAVVHVIQERVNVVRETGAWTGEENNRFRQPAEPNTRANNNPPPI